MDQLQYGFSLKSTCAVPELDAALHQLEHVKSGARLVWLERQEENKTFGIAFQTQPWDDTGIFHILEHSVLCGSERYPVKEPFVELMKSSLNTFLNAMTFPDKTFYPVSSRSEQDFINLLRVYMDAVLHPLIHSRPEIFYQEGWHYEFSETGEPSYKGVVFNEMKGAFASPDTLLEREVNRLLFPDTCYRYVSGGDPEHIPELTYEQFSDAHKRLYHPSNSYIFLDGHMDIDRILSILDEEYLSAYDRAPVPPDIPMQQPVNSGRSEIGFELSPQEDLQGRARLAVGAAACTFRDREKITALRVLADMLCGDNQAPLKRRMLESGLAKDVQMALRDGVQQPWVLLEVRDIAADRAEDVYRTLHEELERLVRDGLDHERILAALDNLEFQMRQRDYGRMPQGLVLGINVLESWLYGGDPAANLSVGSLFDNLRIKCTEGCFEKLLEQVLLKNSHTCQILMLPSHSIGEERQSKEADRIHTACKNWSEEEKRTLLRRQAEIEAWQNAPDTPEALSTIPMLRLEQIPEEPEQLPLIEEEISGLPVLRHTLPTSGITYLNLYFALDDLTADQLTKAAFLCELMGSLNTTVHDVSMLQKVQRSLLGSLQFSVEAYGESGRPKKCRTFLCVSSSMLDAKAENAVELVSEILLDTVLNDPEKVYALLCQRRAALAEQIAMAGHSFAMGRVSASCTVEGAIQEYSGGITYFRWLKDLESNFQDKFPVLQEELAVLSAAVFCRKRLTVSVTISENGPEEMITRILANRLPEGAYSLPEMPAVRPWTYRREGIVIPVDVSFAVMGGVFPEATRGTAKVMGRVVSLAYLWNAVRVQGGAYGTGMILGDSGMAGFYSYRDPSAARTLDCYRRTAEFLENLGDTDMTAFVLGAIAESDPLLTPRMRGKTADTRYWRKIAYDDLCRVRREMLSITSADLSDLISPVQTAVDECAVCILGSQRQIDACAGDLDLTEIL